MIKMDDDGNSYTFIAIVAASVVLAIGLVAGGIYYYVRPDVDQPQDQTQSIDELTPQPQTVTPSNLRESIDTQFDNLSEDDFDQSALSDEALDIN